MFKVKEQIYIKTAEEIQAIKQSGQILSMLHGELSKRIEADFAELRNSFAKNQPLGASPRF